MNEQVAKILHFLKFSERLKFELRHSWLSNDRRESVAEHTWQMALMAIITHPHLEHEVDLEKSLKMIIVHDIVEAEAGDVPFFETGFRQDTKAEREERAIENIRKSLDSDVGEEIYSLWNEFEALNTREAKFAKALDNLEVQIQHNLANLSTWEEIEYELLYTKMDKYCHHDALLKELCDEVKREGELKMLAAGIDIESIKKKLNKTTIATG